jgi:hypothetical protein
MYHAAMKLKLGKANAYKVPPETWKLFRIQCIREGKKLSYVLTKLLKEYVSAGKEGTE